MNELRSRPPVSIRSSGKNSPPNRRKNRNPSIRTNSFCVLVQIDSNCQYGLHKKPMWVGVSLNGGNPISHPKMMIFSRKTHGRVGETHHFRKPPPCFHECIPGIGTQIRKTARFDSGTKLQTSHRSRTCVTNGGEATGWECGNFIGKTYGRHMFFLGTDSQYDRDILYNM